MRVSKGHLSSLYIHILLVNTKRMTWIFPPNCLWHEYVGLYSQSVSPPMNLAWTCPVTLTALNGWDRRWIIQKSNVLSIIWFLPALGPIHWYSVGWQWKLHCPDCQYSSASGQMGPTNLCNVCGDLGLKTHCVRAAHLSSPIIYCVINTLIAGQSEPNVLIQQWVSSLICNEWRMFELEESTL